MEGKWVDASFFANPAQGTGVSRTIRAGTKSNRPFFRLVVGMLFLLFGIFAIPLFARFLRERQD
jgi:hypothetical protein